MLKTLHIDIGRQMYGGTRQVAGLIRGLIARGHHAALLCAEGSEIHQELADEVSAYTVPYHKRVNFGYFLRVIHAIRRERPDVVHIHCRRGAEMRGVMAARLCRVPAVIISRRVDDPIPRNLWNHLRFDALCDRVVAVSEAIRKIVLQAGIPPEKVVCVHSGVDLKLFRQPRDRAWFESEFGVREREPALGVVANLVKRKGHAYLLSAMPQILQRFPDCRLLFFGDGSSGEELRRLTDSMSLSDKVIFAGYRWDMHWILPNLDLLVHPALTEGLAGSLREAASSGVPMVAADAGGVPEIVIDGQTGWLVPTGDVDAIAGAVCSALSDRDLRLRLAQNARAHMEANFSLEQMIEGNLKVYMDTLAAKRSV